MKRALKIIGIVLGVVVLLAGSAAAFIQVRGIPSYEVQAPDLTIEADSAMLARGENLVAMVCADCHRGKGGKFAGRLLDDIPPEFGTVYSANITQDEQYGIGRYTDGELAYLLRTGIKRDGQFAPPYMPKYPHMSDEDLHSIIAYLRSDAAPVEAVADPAPPSQPSFLVKMLCNVEFKPFPYPEKTIVAPDPSDKVAYGRYIATGAVECFHCHSADFKTINDLEPEKTPGFMGGGNVMVDRDGNPVVTANLTMHPEYGLGKWTEADFIRAVKTGQRPDGTMVSHLMPKFSAMSDEEVSAVWTWLQTVPVLEN